MPRTWPNKPCPIPQECRDLLYNPKRNLAFIHIPKNAGQAVRKALSEAEPISYASFAADMQTGEAEA